MKRDHGQSIIELLLAMSMALIILPALFGMFFASREGKAQQIQRTQAVPLAAELDDILNNIREQGWDQLSAFAIGTPYHPVHTNGVWVLVAGEDVVDGFKRSITFERVYRDSVGAIVATGGTEDISSRNAKIDVSWLTPFPSSVRYSRYFTRHTNILLTDTTTADYNAGIQTNTAVRTVGDGEVVLGATGGVGDWCQPTLTISALDLPKSGVANAISAIQGIIAAGTGDNASGVSYANVYISDPATPINPTASVSGTFDGYKTNDVFTEQNVAYIATDNNSKEIVIIDLSNKNASNKYAEIGYFNAPSNGNGNTVVTKENVGYMVTGTMLYSFDLTSKNGSRPLLDTDGVSLPAVGNKMGIVGTRLFIATESVSSQLTIVDISNPSNLTIGTQIALPAKEGVGIYVNSSGTRAYIATEGSVTQKEFFIVNIQASSSEYGTIYGSYDTNGMNPKGVVVVSGPRAIIVGTGAEEYQVIDITNESTNPLSRCGGLEVNSGINGISTVFTAANRAYSYIITGDALTELKIIEGGPGSNGNSFTLNGTFVSRIFDTQTIATGSAMAAFNRIHAAITKSSSVTDISIQVAAAAAVNNSCTTATYVYVGPDGTSGSRYTSLDDQTIVGILPFSYDSVGFENPARCFRYLLTLSTTDSTLTPQLTDMIISLSP